MNAIQLVFKQMRQRSLSTCLTLLSVMLGVALAVAVLVVRREGKAVFGQTEFGYEVLIGPPKGSPLQLVLNTVYHIDVSPGTIPYSVYESLARDPMTRPLVRTAVPIAVGDSYKGHRVVATLPKLLGCDDNGQPLEGAAFEYRPGRRYELAAGRCFHSRTFEAVIGSQISQRTGLKLGDRFRATHSGARQGDEHDEQWQVVGVLKETGTAEDRVVFIPLVTFYAIGEHEKGLREIHRVRGGPPPATASTHQHQDHGQHGEKETDHAEDHAHDHKAYETAADGTITLSIPREQWLLSAVLVKVRGQRAFAATAAGNLMYIINNRAEAVAVNPAAEMRKFFDTFLAGATLVLLLLSVLVTVVAAVSILVSIYNSVSARRQEIAVLRALGATRRKVLGLICLEAALVGLMGGLAGLVAGHLLGAVGSWYARRTIGEGINWLAVDHREALYLAGVVLIALVAGLVPAIKAYRTPVATNLAPT